MNYLWPTLILATLTILIYLGMWKSWQKNKKNSESLSAQQPGKHELGESFSIFQRVQYVSTNSAGKPLDRVQYPGLRYKGYATIAIFALGVTIEVTGEKPVNIYFSQIRNLTAEQMRIGKVVEKGGLIVLSWSAADAQLESSFRFSSYDDQVSFIETMTGLLPSTKTEINS